MDQEQRPTLTDTLCTQCGLCCDGTLLADVELASRAEAARMADMGLRVDEDADELLMLLPCAALKGTCCSVYAHRPKCCRSFECSLLKDVRRGAMDVEQGAQHIAEALKRIARVRKLLGRLEGHDALLPLREACAEAVASEASADPSVARTRAQLEIAMAGVETLLRTTFLRRVRRT
ncbi:MAG: YkgJ family cysteine cluster protein [Candidatus Eisenbacteria bacterium]